MIYAYFHWRLPSNILLININATNNTNNSNYASNISNILLTNIHANTNTNSSNHASNISNVLLTNMNTHYLKLSGGTMAGQLILSTAAGNNPLYILSTATNANNCIQIKNNSTYNSYIGLGGTAFGNNYQFFFFIESASSSIILNTNWRTSAIVPNMIIHSTGNVGMAFLIVDYIYRQI